MKRNKLKLVLVIAYILICILDIVLIKIDHPFSYYTRFFSTIVLLLLYIIASKKLNKLSIAYFVVLLLADFFSSQYDWFNESIIASGITFLILAKIFRDALPYKIKKGTIINFILFLMLFSVIYVYVLEEKGDSYIAVLFYGTSLCILSTLSLSNYLYKETKSNSMFLKAMVMRLLSDAVLALIIFSYQEDLYYDIVTSTIYLISNYLINEALVLNDKELLIKNKGEDEKFI